MTWGRLGRGGRGDGLGQRPSCTPVVFSALTAGGGHSCGVIGQQGQLSLSRPEKWLWWWPQHPRPAPRASPRAVQNRAPGKGRPADAPFSQPPLRPPLGNPARPAQLHLGLALPSTTLSCSALHLTVLWSAGPAPLFRSAARAERCPGKVLQNRANRLCPSHLSCDSSSHRKERQSALGRSAAAPCRLEPLLHYLSKLQAPWYPTGH